MTRAHYLIFTLAFTFCTGMVQAQVPTGTPPFGSFGGGPDIIDLANLNSHLDIPVVNKSGRGVNFTYDLSYDNSVWYQVTTNGVQNWQPILNWGWRGQTEASAGYVQFAATVTFCYTNRIPTGSKSVLSNWVYHDPWGVPHSVSGTTTILGGTCGNSSSSFMSTAADGSGYTMSATGSSATMMTTSGKFIVPPANVTSGSGSGTDRNGNEITVNGSGVFTDTLGTTALTVAGAPPNPTTFTYVAPNGGNAPFTMSYKSYTVKTNFGCSGISDYGPTSNSLVDKITLPDGTFHQLTYEATPGFPGDVTGRVASVTLATGGTISYTYTGGSSGHITCSDGSASGYTRQTPDGTWTYTRTPGSAAASTTTITDPQGNQTVVQFQGIYETQRQDYQGSTSGTLLKTQNTCYNNASSPCTATVVALPINTITVLDQLGSSGPICKHVYSHDNFGMRTETDDYDYAPSSPGPLLRKVITNYAALGNIHAFAQTTQVQDGAGHTITQTTNNYDETTPTATSGTPQHVAVSGSRGNLTSINYPVSGLTAHFTYFDTGTPSTSTDVNGTVTTYSYAGSSCGNSFPTGLSRTQPISMSRSFAWNCTGAVMTQLTDENSKSTSTTYNDAYFWRPDHQTYPDGGQTNWTYTAPWQSSTTQKMNSTQNIATTTYLDGLGRFIYSVLTSDPLGATTNQLTYYDPVGRVTSVYNPTRCATPSSNCGESTWGFTAYSYDALNRVTSIRSQDGSTATASYVNNTATVTDQAGKARKFQIDSLGRVTNVWEDPAGLNYQTVYTYNALDNLIGVVQNGSRNRTFAYDSLSRLLCEANPEISTATCPNPDNGTYTAGTIRYGYDSNGNLTSRVAPAPNQTGSATVTTNYNYDLLHRLTKKSYSDGTPTANFYYDAAPSSWQWPELNTVGRLVEATTNNTATEFTYDPMGRIAQKIVCAPSICTVGANGQTGQGWSFYYTYNLAGGLSQYNDGQFTWPQSFNQTFDGAGRVSQLTSTASDAQHPATFFTADATNGYFPNGALRKAALGNGLTLSNVYDQRFQPCRLNVNSTNTVLSACTGSAPSGNILDLTAGFNLTTSDNGNVASWTATGNQVFNRTYTYDSLNRLKTMADSATAQSCKGLSWTYDPWGNRTNQTMTAGTCGQFQATADAQNRVHDLNNFYLYDAAGNMTHDASHNYSYDAENRLTAVDAGATASYIYDAFGRRTKRTVGSSSYEYVYDNDGQLGWELVNDNVNRGYIRSNGLLLAEYFQGTTYFIHQDHLGSTRLVTAYPSPSIVECDDYYAYGEANVNVGSCLAATNTAYKFTGDERDTETSLDHTWFRQYSSSLARWMTPDPAGLDAVNPNNPQSWNRYSYVANSPVNFIDPIGMWNTPLYDSRGPGGGGLGFLLNISSGLSAGGNGGCTLDGVDTNCGAVQAIITVGATNVNPGNFLNTGNGTFQAYLPGGCIYTTGTNSAGVNEGSCFSGDWVSLNLGSGSNSDTFWNIMNAFWNHLPIAGSFSIPIVPHVGLILSVPFSYTTGTQTACVGGGLGFATPGKSANVGPLVLGNLKNSQSILSGQSLAFNVQANPILGVQYLTNLSGNLGGPTLGTPGGSIAYTWSKCGPVK